VIRRDAPDAGSALVTGLGVVAPNGLGAERYWEACLAGRSGLAEITRFDASGYPVRLAGEVRDFEPADRVPGRLLAQTDVWSQFGLVAADMALADAGLDLTPLSPYDCAVVTATSSGGNLFGQREIQNLWARGPEHVSVYQSIAWFYAATTGQIAIRHGLKGPCGVVVSEQAGGLDCLGQARRVLRTGSRVVIAGGTEAPIGPYALTCQLQTGRLSTEPDPACAYRPFDIAATGYLPGEGGAMLVVEQFGTAAARGVGGYGELAGYAATMDPAPWSGRPSGLARAIRSALADAGVEPCQVAVVFADAAGSVDLDRAEAEALRAVFDERGVPVTAPKTMTGRLYAGGASLDVVAALLSMRDGVIPPTVGVSDAAEEYGIDLVTGAPRPADIAVAVVVARGHGGFNAALVVKAVPRHSSNC
jgi:act minimal PKS chain-length factor (CLF/KS beta)